MTKENRQRPVDSSTENWEYRENSPLTSVNMTPAHEQHPIQRQADRILEECVKQNWSVAFVYAGELVHYCLGRGYHVLAKVAGKLRSHLIPIVHEIYLRKYLLRMLWLLARVKREKDYRYLIFGDKNFCQLKRSGGTETHIVKFHAFDPEAYVPPLNREELDEPRIARLLMSNISVVSDASESVSESYTTSHALFQPPHAKFPRPAAIPHKHQEISQPKINRIQNPVIPLDPMAEN